MIQQNYGEDEEKGFLVWDIRSKNDWDVTFHALVNKIPYLSIPWMGTVKETIDTVEELRGEFAFTKGSRIRVLSNQNISQLECRQLHHEIKEKRECAELVYKIDASKTSIQAIQTGTVTAHKTSLRNDLATLVALYEEYVNAHLLKLNLTPDQLRQGGDFIKGYLHKLKEQDTDETTRDVEWVVKDIEFSNLFRFGENNKISFEKLSGIVGVFGPNRSGKSSVVSALSYGLFNTTEREVGRAVGHYINRNKKNAKCKVRFAANGVNYVVDRTIVLKEPKKGEEATMATTTNLLLYRVDENGKLIPMGNENDISRPDTDKVIRGLIGNPMDFRLTSYSSQGDINRFIDQGATQRKSILNRFLDLDIFEKLFKFANDDRAMLNAKTARFSPVASETAIKQADADLERKEKELTATQATIVALNHQISTLREWLLSNASSTNVASEVQARKQKLEQEVQNLRFKKQDLSTKKNGQQEKLASVLQEELKVEKDKAKFNIQSLLDVQKSLQNFQQDARGIATSLDKETTLLETQKKSVKKLETVPCGNMFPGCRFIKDSHDDKVRLPIQQDNVDKLTQEATLLNQQIRDLASQGVDDKIKAYNLLIQSEASLEKKRLALESDLNIIKVQLGSVEDHLEEKEEELASPEYNVQQEDLTEVKRTQALIVEKEKSLFVSETQKNKLLMEIGNLQGRLEQLLVEKEQCTAILAQLQVLDSVVEAFSKNGIPAMVLKTQLPAINDELAKILSNVVDFKVSLETEVTSNTLDVYIEDGSSKRIIELASGMEKFVASLALRVALINLSSLPRTNMFIVDEGFGVLDEDSIVKCLQLLSSLKNYFKLILIISHIPQVKEIADRMVEVVNLGSESRVEV
jgi:DNA repair exonuclease SbcCD ATPase subunit